MEFDWSPEEEAFPSAHFVGTEMSDLALDIMGPYGFLWQGSEHAAMGGDMIDHYLMAGHPRGAAAGVDTPKAIVARRLLRLPNALGKPVGELRPNGRHATRP